MYMVRNLDALIRNDHSLVLTNAAQFSEALASGQIRVIPRLKDLQEVDEAEEEIVEETDMISRSNVLNELPLVDRCDVCLEDEIHGFALACDHSMCIGCSREIFFAAVRDVSLLPLRCCEVPIDMNICRHLLPAKDVQTIMSRMAERDANNKMYCPVCNKFINLDLVDVQESTELMCVCETVICISCKTASHPMFTCAENEAVIAGDDALLLERAREEGWKQCPACNVMIELTHGCNHITCRNCDQQFCFSCLSPWGDDQCSSGRCAVWDEDRLFAAGEARVEAEENALQRARPAVAREERVRRAMHALRENEGCDHQWVRRYGYLGNCERCNYDLPCYGMRCESDCESTVCYTCAHFRIPARGWR